MAIYKGSRFEEGKNRQKMGVVIADFSKIDARLKALYVRFKGHSRRGTACRALWGLKALQIKGFMSSKFIPPS